MPVGAAAIVSVGLGLGLAAACGFRLFVPLLALSLGARAGLVPLAGGWEWVASTPALIAFATATLAEVAAYYVPWLDHLLDLVATPAAVVAGMVVSASVIADLPPLVKWTAVMIGGGGLAALVQGATVALRAGSSATTGGLANPVVATGELAGAAVASLVALVAPWLALALVVLAVVLLSRAARRRRRGSDALH